MMAACRRAVRRGRAVRSAQGAGWCPTSTGLIGPKRALKRNRILSLNWENAIEAQVEIEGGIRRRTVPLGDAC